MKFRTNSIDGSACLPWHFPAIVSRYPAKGRSDQNRSALDVMGLLIIASFLLMGLAGCSPPPAEMIHLRGETMGTTYSVKVINDGAESAITSLSSAETLGPLSAETLGPLTAKTLGPLSTETLGPLSAKTLGPRIDNRLVELNQVFSTYIVDSELSVLNRSSGTIPVTQELHRVLRLAWDVYALSEGAFDVTVGPLVNLWGFGPDGPASGVPGDAEIERAKANVGLHRLVLGSDSITKPANISIDLSSLAKGYAVEDIARLLEAAGATRYLVEIGGEVKAMGNNMRGGPWRIGVETPDITTRRIQKVLPIKDSAMATSGDYRNFFEADGQIYSHTLDPATGKPVVHGLASVTVLDIDAGFADAIATAFLVMGIEKTMVLAKEKNLRVLAILRHGPDEFEEIYSPAMQQYLREHQ